MLLERAGTLAQKKGLSLMLGCWVAAALGSTGGAGAVDCLLESAQQI